MSYNERFRVCVIEEIALFLDGHLIGVSYMEGQRAYVNEISY